MIVKTHSCVGEKVDVGGVLCAKVQMTVSTNGSVKGCVSSKGNTRQDNAQSHITHTVPRSV